MTVFVCIDDRGGMTFNARRQSRDVRVIEDMIKDVGDKALYVTDFSEELFLDSEASAISLPDPLTAAPDSFVFIENLPLAMHLDRIKRLVIYRWNRKYPFDTELDVNPEKEGFILTRVTEFAGNSHEKITKEVYER